jgi:hypothetical protein
MSQRHNHSAIFIFKESSHRRRKDQQWRAAMPEDQGLHVAMQFLAIGLVVFAVHFPGIRRVEVSYLILPGRRISFTVSQKQPTTKDAKVHEGLASRIFLRAP